MTRTHPVIAQYFQAADRIVILGDHGVKEQGTWQEIQVKSASITKFIPNTVAKSDATLLANFDKLRAQFRARDEAEVDLSRKTGDLSLYSTVPAHICRRS